MKAVLFAGDAEKNLRPITCTTPKPLLPIVGRPLMSYLLETLHSNGVSETYLFLPYADRRITEFFKTHAPKGMAVHAVSAAERDDAVQQLEKNAEPLCFVSRICFWEFDLKDALRQHSETDADLTAIILRSAEMQNGTLLLTNDESQITGAYPNAEPTAPSAGGYSGGVYFLRPDRLRRAISFAENWQENFDASFFTSGNAYAYTAQGYFNALQSPAAYRACIREVLSGKTQIRLPHPANGIFTFSALPKGDYQLIPPVYIGENVTVENGAKIGPYTVLESGCTICAQAKVENSIVLGGAAVRKKAALYGAVLCENATASENAVLSADSIVGACSDIGRHARVGRGARVWQHCTVEDGMYVSGNVRNSMPQTPVLFENGQISTPRPIDPIFLARFGSTLAGCPFGKRVGVLHDGSAFCEAAAQVLTGTLSAQGSGVWLFGKGFLPQLHFYTAFCDLQTGIFLSTHKSRVCLHIFSAGGLMLTGEQVAMLSSRLQFGDYAATVPEHCKTFSDMHDMQALYLRELLQEAGEVLEGQSVRVQCPNAEITMLLEDALYRLHAGEGDDITLRLSFDGTRVTAFHRECGYLPHERLLAICCNALFERGQDVALSADAPFTLEQFAAKNGRRVLHYPVTANAKADPAACALAREQLYVRDGLFLSMRLLGILQQSGKSLAELHRALPQFFVRQRVVSFSLSPKETERILGSPEAQLHDTGIVLHRADGRILLSPQQAGRKLRILVESTQYETAKSLCEAVEESLIKH